MQGVLAALAAGKLKLATLPALVFTLSNTYGARGYCCGAFCELWLLWHASRTPAVTLMSTPTNGPLNLPALPHQV